jgi:hypothetical protein
VGDPHASKQNNSMGDNISFSRISARRRRRAEKRNGYSDPQAGSGPASPSRTFVRTSPPLPPERKAASRQGLICSSWPSAVQKACGRDDGDVCVWSPVARRCSPRIRLSKDVPVECIFGGVD